MLRFLTLTGLVLCAACAAPPAGSGTADLIVVAGDGWTGDSARPSAQAIAIKDGRITAVGTRTELLAHSGPGTRVIDRPDAFLTPGFIDNHTHFQSAGNLLLNVNLLDVSDEAGLVRRVREARDRMPQDAWLVGGQWGAYESWEQGATGREEGQQATQPFNPHRAMIDSITPETPALLEKWDRSAYLANRRALEEAGIDCSVDGVECDNGDPTGRISAGVAARIRRGIPAKSFEQRMAESRAALRRLAEMGVTTIHDNTPASQMEIYQELHANDELSVRVYARPTLDRWQELSALGIEHGFGDEWLKIGGLKGFVDGIMGASSARFYEPYLTTGVRGSWRTMMTEPPGMLELLIGADAAGHWPQVHAIGDEAIDTLITMFEHVMRVNGPKERRFRVIHTQVIRGPEVARKMAELGLIAEVQPYHAIDDMRWMEERIGERGRWAYAFRTLQDAGVRLSFGSDWPGTNASWYPANPMQGIYAAVTRQTLDGEPAEGWFPEERIDVETAMRAYTVNNAWAAGEEDLKGSLTPGKLADVVLLDASPFEVPPSQIKDIRALVTIVGGRVVHEANGN